MLYKSINKTKRTTVCLTGVPVKPESRRHGCTHIPSHLHVEITITRRRKADLARPHSLHSYSILRSFESYEDEFLCVIKGNEDYNDP